MLKKPKNRLVKLVRLVLCLILFVLAFYGLAWLHECGHALATVLNGVRVNQIGVNLNAGWVDSDWNSSNYSAKGIVTIMGWVATLSVAIPLCFYSFVKKNKWMFFLAFLQIFNEMIMWGISPFVEWGDAYNLIKWAEYFKLDVIIEIVYFTAVLIIIIAVVLYVVSFYIYTKWTD